MKASVTKDKVSIIEKDIVHAGEYNINHIEFEFSAEYTADLVKNAVFSIKDNVYQTSIINDQCDIPAEILSDFGEVVFGVYAYKVNDDQLELRYSPFPARFTIISGSYDPTAEESEEITPSQFEQYMQAMNDGLNKVEESLKKMDSATSAATQLVDDINQKLENGDFIGPEGQQGVQGTPGKDGINGADGVGITTITSGQSTVEEDKTITPITVNKTDGSSESFNVEAKNGADGKDGLNGKDGVNGQNGQDGTTPNIQIGTVETLEPNEQAMVTRTGTDEEPIFNFGIPKGQQGEKGQDGTNGTDGKDATINGQNTVEITTDNNITLDQQESVLKLGLNSQLIPKNNAEGTDNTFDDGLESPLFALSGDGKSEQVITTGKQLFDCELELGTISSTGIPTLSNTSLRSKNFQNVTANTQYTISCNSTNSIALRFYQEDETFISSGTTQQSPNTFTTPENCTKFKFVIIDNNNLSLETMLNLGSSVLPYEPYSNGIPSPSPDYEQPINSIEDSLEFACNDNKGSSNQVTFDLGEEKLRSVGDVKDELVVDLDTGDYFKVENIGEIILDGSDDENWNNIPDGTGKERYTSSIIQSKVYTGTKLCQSNYFKNDTSEEYYEDGTIKIAPSGGVSIYDDLFTSLDNFKQWLSTHNTIVNYILKTPTTKKLGTLSAEDLAKLKTFKGYNNVTINTNLGLMNIRFTYGLDIKKYVDNKIAELSAQMIEEG